MIFFYSFLLFSETCQPEHHNSRGIYSFPTRQLAWEFCRRSTIIIHMSHWLRHHGHQPHQILELLQVWNQVNQKRLCTGIITLCYFIPLLLIDEKSSQVSMKHRVVLMGSAFVGKTQIVSQFLYDKFSGRYRQTIEELHRGEYNLPDGSSLTLDILDTSGAFQFPAMQALSISTSNAFILVFSIDSEESWNEVVRLREKVWAILRLM